jgi:hypothetical protein
MSLPRSCAKGAAEGTARHPHAAMIEKKIDPRMNNLPHVAGHLG